MTENGPCENRDDYESRATQIFCSVMDVVRTSRKVDFLRERLRIETERAHIDKRLIDALENECARILEEPGYKMRTIAWIREDIRRVDRGEETQFWSGE